MFCFKCISAKDDNTCPTCGYRFLYIEKRMRMGLRNDLRERNELREKLRRQGKDKKVESSADDAEWSDEAESGADDEDETSTEVDEDVVGKKRSAADDDSVISELSGMTPPPPYQKRRRPLFGRIIEDSE